MSNALLDHPLALCNQVRRLAIEAGAVTLQYYDESGYTGAEVKGDGSPVTIADREAEKVIEAGLRDILPGIVIVGEEAIEAGFKPDLTDQDYFWLVDALDGTKEFISGSGDFTVNIALVKDGAPVLGVVYAPALGELYAAHGPKTAVRWNEDTDKEKEIYVRKPPKEGLTVVASLNHGNDEKLQSFLEGQKIQKVLKRGSSLKICSIACGKADIYPRLGPTSEWDIAAGHAVLIGAGGTITDMTGKPLTYKGSGPDFTNPDFIASSGYVVF